jgi:hypothetical protein
LLSGKDFVQEPLLEHGQSNRERQDENGHEEIYDPTVIHLNHFDASEGVVVPNISCHSQFVTNGGGFGIAFQTLACEGVRGVYVLGLLFDCSKREFRAR